MNEPPLGWTTEAYINKVIDGDTIEVELRKTIRVRLLNVNAPETRTKDLKEKELGLKIKEKVEALLPIGSRVILFIPTKEKDVKDLLTLSRVLGTVFIDGKDVSEILKGYIDAKM